MQLTKEVIVNILITGLPLSGALVNSQSPPYFGLCKVVVEAAKVITQLTDAGLSDVINIEVSTSNLDRPDNCVLAYEQCQLTNEANLEAVAQVHPQLAYRVDLHNQTHIYQSSPI